MIINILTKSKWKFFILIGYFTVINLATGYCQNTISDETWNETSEKKGKLLIFSGSDWCVPCIKFDRAVLQTELFKNFAKTNLSVLVADFPQHKNISKKEINRNEELAKKYNPNGYFPYVLLLQNNGKILTQINTQKATPETVIKQIKLYLPQPKLVEFDTTLMLMGSSFQISLIAEKEEGEQYLLECIRKIKEIEGWLSSWEKGSITNELNEKASKYPVQVTNEYYQLVKRCISLSALTQGAFDITFGGLANLYTFDKMEYELPSAPRIAAQLKGVGYQQITMQEAQKIGFSNAFIKIGFGAIGKGYAADKVKELMQTKGVKGGVINASGDLTTWGTRVNGLGWNVGIPNPSNLNEIILWLPLNNKAIATSGDYEKYFTSKGTHYSHIINPKTGLPVVGSSSVSIISNSAELSDALATAVSVLGVEVGMNLVNQLKGVECVFIDNNHKLHFSNGLKTYAKNK